MASIGQSEIRLDAKVKVTGEAQFSTDFNFPNQAYMKFLFAQRAHALVKRVDTSKAEALPGVLAVLTAKDVPINEFGYIKYDQPVLCGPGSLPHAERVRYPGDRIAFIVAESEEIAAQARDLIVVDYEDLPVVTDPLAAMQPDATLLHPNLGSNVLAHHKIRTGDVDSAFASADVIVEGVYQTPPQEHAFLQPEAGIAYLDEEGRITLVSTGQWAAKDQGAIAHALDIPNEQVRIIYPPIGGSFGGREDITIQIALALAVQHLNQRGMYRPVKITWTREESMFAHIKRHPYHITAKWGARKDGRVIAAEVKLVSDGGAYESTSRVVTSVAILNCTGIYDIPNIKVDSYDVYTNKVPRGAFRGFGGPQGTFVAECQMNKLAEKLGMDPVELRMRNLASDGTLQSVGSPFPPGVSIRAVVEKCATAAGWEKTPNGWNRKGGYAWDVPGQPNLKRAIGLACSHKNIGFSHGFQEFAWVTIELHGKAEIEKAILKHTATEVGQGIHTIMGQMAAEALGIPFEKIEVITPDTSQSNDTGAVSASRMTFMAGNAIREAGALALQKWQDEERPAVIVHQYLAPPTTPMDSETGHCDPMVAYAYTAEAVEVELDSETGLARLVKVICANDVGKAINPQVVEGQLEGALVQAAGYTMMENFIEKDGIVLTPNFSTYLIPTVLDIPDEMQTMIMEIPDPRGPWGARGVGEMPMLPFAPATVAAMHAATGVWFNEFPLTPERILKGMGKI